MKKTLIALAVAASAAVSGSAMAWTANGTRGSVDLGGTLKPVEKITPWEVKVGAAANGLNADIRKGDTKVNVLVKNAIPVLGIRTVEAKPFQGQSGIAPQIDFKGAVAYQQFSNGETKLTLPVTDNAGAPIGNLVAPFIAGAKYSVTGPDANSLYFMAAGQAGEAYYGGLPTSKSVISDMSRVDVIDDEFAAKFVGQGQALTGKGYSNSFANTKHKYSSYYGSGIEKGKNITITLKQAASGDALIQWKASLPVTISYQ
ncbi:hypothetical protein [Escherichia coli]|uniref:F4 family fimbrial subunit n=1 Tax=Escherichia coli TaxID=562 RepID=UPI00234CC0DA|nr:hypothetical protein [Escherichia coli]MDC6785535.1 hypothetical protein [Escherichia coli]MDC6834927.1 hypothetical protein [Escherichia coli]